MTEQLRLRVADIATRTGLKPDTWSGYVSRGHAPKPDGYFDRRTPWWWESTIDAWLANRPGRGARTDRRTRTDSEETPNA